MSRQDVIKALKVSEREAPYVWDVQDEDERPATPDELAHGLALARKRGRVADSGVNGADRMSPLKMHPGFSSSRRDSIQAFGIIQKN